MLGRYYRGNVTSGSQLEKHCVTSLECVSMVLHRNGFMGLCSFEGIWKRFSCQHHEPSTMMAPLWRKGRDMVEDSSVFGDFL